MNIGLLCLWNYSCNKAIQIDSYKNLKNEKVETRIVQKVDVFTEVRTYSPDIILSQKIYALFNRKRAKGRDLYDVVYMFSLTEPDWKYLNSKLKIDNIGRLKDEMSRLFSESDLKALKKDVEPFLINPKKVIQVEKFNEWVKGL